MVKVNTNNILFIIGGAFPQIEEIVKKRFNSQEIGFNAKNKIKTLSKEEIYQNVTHEDIIEYGIIPEFMGRISNVAPLMPLKEKDILTILTKPKNSIIKQYTKLFELDGVELVVKKDALEYIAKKVIEKKLGARGLNSYLEDIMQELMYEVPSNKKIKKIIINKKVIEKKEEPIYEF